MHPQPRVRNRSKHTSVVTTGSPEASGIPARDGFNGFLRALPGDRAFLSPSSADRSANLTPASRRQDHTTSPSASASLVKSTNRVHRIPSRVRDDREPPLVATRRRGYNFDLGQIGSGKFFEMGLDSPNHVDPVQQIRPCAQL